MDVKEFARHLPQKPEQRVTSSGDNDNNNNFI
jgi:hypothetical protein